MAKGNIEKKGGINMEKPNPIVVMIIFGAIGFLFLGKKGLLLTIIPFIPPLP